MVSLHQILENLSVFQEFEASTDSLTTYQKKKEKLN